MKTDSKCPIETNREDGQIGEGVFVAYEWILREDDARTLCRMYIGTSSAGPILLYDADGSDKWDGVQHSDFRHGAWTPLYSRGDYGKSYACGGQWSGHTLNLVGYLRQDLNFGPQIIIGGRMMPVPDGVAGDGELISLDCKGGWAIWYQSALEALRARLTPGQIQASTLPQKTKKHLASNESELIIEFVREVVDAYKI